MGVEKNSESSATLESITDAVPVKPIKNLGGLAVIHHSGQIDLSALVYPIDRFIFYDPKQNKWMEIGEGTRELYVEIAPAEIDKYASNPSKWALLGPVDQMPQSIEMYALHERKPNRKLYKPTE